MSIRSNELGSTEAHLVCEGITQQPGSFYNGNFSSSIWGNPPTPPLWRDMSAPNALFSASGGQSLVFSSSSKQAKESVISCKIETLNRKEEKVSRWAGHFPSGQQAELQESSTSPFSFGFPPPSPSPPSNLSSRDYVTSIGSSYSGKSTDVNGHKKPINGKCSMLDKESSQCFTHERAFSLKELSNKWESMLQSQDGPYCSVDSQSPVHGPISPYLSVGPASSTDIRQPPKHSYGNPFANADNCANSLHKQQSLEHSHGNPFVNSDVRATSQQQPLEHSHGNPFANSDVRATCRQQPLEHSHGNPFANSDVRATSQQQPVEHSYGNLIANSDTHATSLHVQQSFHQFTGIPSASPNLENYNRTPLLFSQMDDSGTFVFGSCPVSNPTANVGFSKQKDFVFGSRSASDMRANVEFSQQRDAHSSPAGSMPRSSITNTKVKKHNIFSTKKNITAPVSRVVQPGPSKPGSDMSCFSNSVFKFNMGTSDSDCSHRPNLGCNNMDSANSGCGPAPSLQNLCASAQSNSIRFGANKTGSESPSFLAGAASIVTEDTHSLCSSVGEKLFQQRSKTQRAQSICKQFSTCHPFLQKEENSIKHYGLDRDFVEVSSSKSTSFLNNSDKVHEKCEASGVKAGFSHEELPNPSLETNRNFEGIKLAEFNLNSPGKLSVEDLREKAAKWVRSGEEIKRQKENQEPNFVFGGQKASRPFVFSASRTPGSMKHATLSTDDMNKKDCRSKGNKESKVLEHLINKLGEKMANLGKSHGTQSNHAAYRGETVAEGIKEFDASTEGSRKKLPTDSLGFADIFEKNVALSRSIEELREQLAKLGASDNQVNRQNDKAGQFNSSFHGNGIALEPTVERLREQIAKLGNFGGKKEEDTADKAKSSTSEAQHTVFCDSNAIKHAVEELSEQIAKLGRAVRGNNQDDYLSTKAYQNDVNEESVEGLREEMATLGKMDKEENNHNPIHESMSRCNENNVQGTFVCSACNTTAAAESDSTRFHQSKVSAGNSRGANFINTARINPFRTVSQSTLFPNNAFVGVQSSSCFPMVKPFTAGQSPFFTEAHNGANFSCYEMPSSSNGAGEGSSQKGFEFHGTKGSLRGTAMWRKNGRARLNTRRREKENLTRTEKSSVLQGKIHSASTSLSTGSPMDFSPDADKHAPSLPKFGSDETHQTPVWKFPGPNFIEDESINVEELRMATSKLTVGKEDESGLGDQKNSRSSEHLSEETSPSVLHQKKGTWKRVLRNKSSTKWMDSKLFGSKAAPSGASGIDRRVTEEHTLNSFSGEGFNLRSFSPSGDTHLQDAREKPLRKSTWSQGSSVFVYGKGENITPSFASTKPNQSFGFDKLGNEQKVSSISRELPASPMATRTATSEQVCENWRSRGNQAYAKGDYEKAEDCYSRGIGSVSPEDASQSCIRASMLCYSNRAATRMAVGRMREALEDCKRAMILDSSFLRVRLRAASCHLSLGENNAAAALFVECWNRAKQSSDMKIAEEAMEGIRKSQQFDDLLKRASKLCQGETSTDVSDALNLLNEALLICPFSETLLELKAQTLFSVRRFEDVLQLCQQTLPAAEENNVVHQHCDQSVSKDNVSLNLWRWRMSGKCLFHLGRLEESSSLLSKYEEATCRISSQRAANIESMAALLSNIRDLLQHKASGNEAFQAGKHDEAVEHYTAALACNGESRPYNAVCFCNRAAASQALGHIADAIADCSRAIVLDLHYAKAISRRATLHEMVKDYGQTCNDLGRLVALLEGQEACSKSPKSTRAGSKNAQDLRQARDRLEKATMELKKGCAVDHYLILGLDVTCSSSDVKKAYRKAALKHHPDKAGQVLVRGENADDGSLWKEVGDEARRDAERLFKLIGEAYATLSDPSKRAQYDLENHMPRARNPSHSGYGSTDDNCSPYEKSGRRHRERREWHSSRYYRWQSGPDAAQPDTYSDRVSRDSSASKDSRNRGKRTDFYW